MVGGKRRALRLLRLLLILKKFSGHRHCPALLWPDSGLPGKGVISYNQVALARGKGQSIPEPANGINGELETLCLSAGKSFTTA